MLELLCAVPAQQRGHLVADQRFEDAAVVTGALRRVLDAIDGREDLAAALVDYARTSSERLMAAVPQQEG